MRKEVESPTIAERDTSGFPTDFAVSYGYRPDPNRFDGYLHGSAANTWAAVLAVVAIGAITLAVLFAGGHV